MNIEITSNDEPTTTTKIDKPTENDETALPTSIDYYKSN